MSSGDINVFYAGTKQALLSIEDGNRAMVLFVAIAAIFMVEIALAIIADIISSSKRKQGLDSQIKGWSVKRLDSKKEEDGKVQVKGEK